MSHRSSSESFAGAVHLPAPSAAASAEFDRRYESHLRHLRLKGLQPKTIEAYSRGIRRMGDYFNQQIGLTPIPRTQRD